MKVLEQRKDNHPKNTDTTNYITINHIYKPTQKEKQFKFQTQQHPPSKLHSQKHHCNHNQKENNLNDHDIKDPDQKDQPNVATEKVNKEIKQSITKKQLKSEVLLDHQRWIMDQELYKTRGQDILQFYLELEKGFSKREFLKKHLVTEELRARMIDWMVEVLCQYKCTAHTFFRSVHIMDQYLHCSKKELKNKDVHLIGMVSMFIGTKYEEIWPLKLKTIYQKIGHKKFSDFVIRNLETQMLDCFDYKIERFSVYDFVELFLQDLRQLERKDILDEKMMKQLEQVCLYLSKMVYYDYQIMKSFCYSHMATGIVYVSFKIVEQVNHNFQITYLTCHIKKFIGISEDHLFKVSTKILNLAKNFERFYKGLGNLKKFNGFQFEDNKNISQ